MVSTAYLRSAAEPHGGGLDKVARDHFRRGRNLQIEGDLHGALSEYDAALVIAPRFIEALNNRGGVLGQLGHLEDALRDFSESLRIEPNDSLVLFNRGIVRLLSGDIPSSLLDFTRSIELREDPLALVNRGIAFTKAGRFQEAQTDLDRALTLDPHDSLAQLNRAALRYIQRDFRGALEDVNLALPYVPEGEATEQADLLHRRSVESLLNELADKGFAYWSGGKPHGTTKPVKLTPGPSISEMIHEMRR